MFNAVNFNNGRSDIPTVSIILCTRNRAEHLRATLDSLAEVQIPLAWEVELLLVDNGSSDHTQRVIERAEFPHVVVRSLKEPRRGLSLARNKAVEEARGEVLLFTDDDVRVPENWVEGMTTPILTGPADAVAGGVTLAPYLKRAWQAKDPWLTSPLATTAALDEQDPTRLVGANMAISKRVFEVIPCFDTNLGAGTDLQMGEETLFTQQMKSRGFTVVSAFDIAVEHRCEERRLSRDSYLEASKNIGRSQGYIDYHWKHATAHPGTLLLELALRAADRRTDA